MKRFGLVWCCLGLGALAGCSSSVANQEGASSERSAVSTPEWVIDDSENPNMAIATQVQPIPDTDEPVDDNSARIIKPIPDDDRD